MKNFQEYPARAALLVVAVSIFVIVGWAIEVPALTSMFIGTINMKFNTAVCFFISSCSLLALIAFASSKNVIYKYLSFAMSLFVIMVASATLLQYLLNIDLGIDQYFFRDLRTSGNRFPPGRFAPLTGLNFIALSLAILVELKTHPRLSLLSRSLTLIALFASFQSLAGFFIGLTSVFGSAYYTQMAFPTSLAFVILSIGVLLLHPDSGFIRAFTTPSKTAGMMRWMLLTAIVVPLLTRWMAKIGFESGLYDQDILELIFSIGVTIPMAIIIVFIGNQLIRAETAQHKQHADLLESQEQFKALVDISAQIVWFSEPDGTLVDESASWRHFTGQSYDERKGKGWLNVVHEDDRIRAWNTWAAAVESLTQYSVEYRVLHVSGEWRWMWARGRPLFNSQGEVRGWVGMNSDIHEEKMNAIALNQAKNEADRSNQLKSAFLANMSHEIRTPLGAILGFSELLNIREIPPETQAGYIETIRRNGELLETIISDILDLSKVEAGQLVIEYLPTRPRDILNDVFEMLQAKAFDKNLEFHYDLEESTCESLVTDPTRLKQILINLVGNALKFTAQGSVVMKSRAWDVGGEAKGIMLTIQDTGIGIAQDQLEAIFELFVQADNSMTRRFGGTGLGLSLSRKLARTLGGDVIITQSTLGEGTTFEVTIEDRRDLIATQPLNYGLRQPLKMDADLSESLEGLKILVVDDAPDNQMLISLLLSEFKVDIDCAFNGQIACEKVRAQDFDLVLMDLQMPIMDGYAATQLLREEGYTLPIIAVTAHAMSDIKSKCTQVGFTDYLPKPINFPELLGTITRYTEATN